MPLAKVSLTETDIQLLTNKKKLNSGIRIKISLISVIILLVVYFYVGFDISNYTFIVFGIMILFIHGFLFISSVKDVSFYNDLNEKQKYSGIIKVTKKEHWIDDENDWERYNIDFNEWRIGSKSFHVEYWNKINEGDEFYIEQAINSGFVFRLEKETQDFKNGILKELK